MKVLGAILIICLAFATQAQTGSAFPAMEASTVEDKVINLPAATSGKFTVIGVAYSEDAERDLRSWYDPIYTMFIDESGINSLVYDVNVKLVLMFTGPNKVAINKAKKNMKEVTDEALFEYVLFYKGDLKPYKQPLGLKDKKKPYIFVLDKSGKIIHHTSGRCSQQKIDAIGELVEE